MQFEWDEAKNRMNIRKHGISFEMATGVFFDEYRIERVDYLHSADEERLYTIGRIESILFVVFTERKDSIRIISARKATKEEENEYYKANDIGRG